VGQNRKQKWLLDCFHKYGSLFNGLVVLFFVFFFLSSFFFLLSSFFSSLYSFLFILLLDIYPFSELAFFVLKPAAETAGLISNIVKPTLTT